MWLIRSCTSQDMTCLNSTNALLKLLCLFFKPQMSLQGLKSNNIHASYNPPSSYPSDDSGHPLNISGTICFVLFILCPLYGNPRDNSWTGSCCLFNGTSFKCLMVWRQKVLDALLWLKDNNLFFQDIVLAREQISRLPVQGVTVDLLQYWVGKYKTLHNYR